jgi:hypothetical protein
MSKALDILMKIEIDKMLKMDLNEVGKYLTEDIKLFRNTDDIKLFIYEYVPKALTEDQAIVPICYGPTDEEILEEEKYLEADEEMLTDEYIKNNF